MQGGVLVISIIISGFSCWQNLSPRVVLPVKAEQEILKPSSDTLPGWSDTEVAKGPHLLITLQVTGNRSNPRDGWEHTRVGCAPTPTPLSVLPTLIPLSTAWMRGSRAPSVSL